VRALTTTRRGGFSDRGYASFNLAGHVGDDPRNVARNREKLMAELGLPNPPRWLEQVHGCGVVDDRTPGSRADAAITAETGRVCAVLTADCLPVLLCDREGTRVAAVHAGWRGMAAGVIESTIDAMEMPGDQLLAWLGPAIGPDAFEVGPEVRSAMVATHPEADTAFRAGEGDRLFMDIYQVARQRLVRKGLGFVGGGDYCTVSQPDLFYSYRRDRITGRMATLIWIEP
jgi:YfiH family protein